MSFWREPELPPVQQMPRRRGKKGPSYGGRMLAGFAGVVLAVTGAIGVVRAVQDPSGNVVMALAVILPSVLLIRYALTGQIKV
jgi:hypothetical protein